MGSALCQCEDCSSRDSGAPQSTKKKDSEAPAEFLVGDNLFVYTLPKDAARGRVSEATSCAQAEELHGPCDAMLVSDFWRLLAFHGLLSCNTLDIFVPLLAQSQSRHASSGQTCLSFTCQECGVKCLLEARASVQDEGATFV